MNLILGSGIMIFAVAAVAVSVSPAAGRFRWPPSLNSTHGKLA